MSRRSRQFVTRGQGEASAKQSSSDARSGGTALEPCATISRRRDINPLYPIPDLSICRNETVNLALGSE